MGYTTEFFGTFKLSRQGAPAQLNDNQFIYLNAFADIRHMIRQEPMTEKRADWRRAAVELPVGDDGMFFVGSKDTAQFGQEGLFGGGGSKQDAESLGIISTNHPGLNCPGLWCQWVPTKDGTGIAWNGAEKFYQYEGWLAFLCKYFLTPWGYELSGIVEWRGESQGDDGELDGAHIQKNATSILEDSLRHKYNVEEIIDLKAKFYAEHADDDDQVALPGGGQKALGG